MIIPENIAIAITGEKPDQASSGPKKYLQTVASTTSINVKSINLPFIFINNKLNEIMKPVPFLPMPSFTGTREQK